jgi:flavin reductase (DIM6/NTAB) family NADH-FMN oxidoreductase RutF
MQMREIAGKDGGMHVFQPVSFEDIESGPYQFGGDNWMLITSEKDGKVNSMTASWGGVGYIWDKRCSFIFVRESRYTKELLDASGVYSLSFMDHKEYHGTMKYLGMVSGRNEDKIAGARLHIGRDQGIPYLDEASSVILCRIMYRQAFEESGFVVPDIVKKVYKDGDYHTMYVGEMVKAMIR